MDATTETPSMDAPGEAATDDTSQWTEAEWAKWRKKKNKKYKNKENQKARRDADAKAKATAKAAAATGAPPAPPAPRAPGDEPETEGAGTGEAASSSGILEPPASFVALSRTRHCGRLPSSRSRSWRRLWRSVKKRQ